MKDFLLIEDEEIKLNSGLNEYMFGKTSYSSIITQAGIYFDGENFSEWTFNDVKSFKVSGKDDPQVFYCGKNPLSKDAKTLLEYFECGNHDKMFDAAFAVCSMITKAAKEGFNLPSPGAAAILIDFSKNSQGTILLLPENLFKYSTAALSQHDQANVRGCWINETLTGLAALCFFRATIAYTMLTGEFPYSASDPIERNADIFDKKFLPLEIRLPNVSKQLAKEINKSLQLNSSVVNEPGKKQKGTSIEDLTPTVDFPLDLLQNEKNNIPSKEHQLELSAEIQNYIKKRDSKINTKRAVRRNTTKIFVICSIIVVLFFSIISSIKSHKKEYTTQSLTSTQTIQAFLKNINLKDATMLGNFTKGKQASKYTDTISQVYVLSKQRQAYAKDNGFATPENYFIYVTDAYKNQSSGLYGLTHVKIDGTEFELDIEIPTFEQNLPPIVEENGIKLENNTTTTHKVEYFLLHTEGENSDIMVEAITEVYTLVYKANRWFISHIDTQSEEIEVNSAHFKLEYFNLLKENDYDVIRSVETMSFSYPWVPSTKSIEREQKRLIAVSEDIFFGIL